VTLRFGPFTIDPANRRLSRDGLPVDLPARYFDALALLVGQAGSLVTKDRFMAEVWRGVPVTDEALTQCIKELRRALGDDAASPRFIETVPKHGYRFVMAVEGGVAAPMEVGREPWHDALLIGGAGVIGGGLAGGLVGILYGFAGVSPSPGTGAASVLLVLICLAILAALIGALGIMAGIAVTMLRSGRPDAWSILGGAGGGLVMGALAKLLGLDAFSLLLGQSPGDITGAGEGLALGAATGLACWLAGRMTLPRSVALALALGAATGVLLALTGGTMFGGSLDLLARTVAGSRISLDGIGGLFGETGYGPLSRLASGGIEGALFVGGMVWATRIAARQLRSGTG
jgi:DNA-binding winged helix-turn-helix (wHTH) protein